MEKHYRLTIDQASFTFARDTEQIAAEAALDGIYIIRSTVNATRMDAGQVVATYKSLGKRRTRLPLDQNHRPDHVAAWTPPSWHGACLRDRLGAGQSGPGIAKRPRGLPTASY